MVNPVFDRVFGMVNQGQLKTEPSASLQNKKTGMHVGKIKQQQIKDRKLSS